MEASRFIFSTQSKCTVKVLVSKERQDKKLLLDRKRRNSGPSSDKKKLIINKTKNIYPT